METCAKCGKSIHSDELVSAVFSSDRKRSFFHKECEEGIENFSRWKEEASWTYKPTRLTVKNWASCSTRKHLGVWQSTFITRRDEDVWCPDCGLKIARHPDVKCASCSGSAIVLSIDRTRMVFTHGEPLFKILSHCTEEGDDSSSYAIISGYTPVSVTSRDARNVSETRSERLMLKYSPKGDPKQGLTV